MGDIASNLLRVLLGQSTPSVWSSIRQNEAGWLEFVISQGGIDQWRQQLSPQTLQTLQTVKQVSSQSITPEQLWQLQSGYELCCRWQACYQQMGGVAQVQTDIPPGVMFSMPHPPLYQLIHCLLDICDGWDEATQPQLLQMSKQLIMALEQCAGATTPASSEAGEVSRWLRPTQVVLKQLLGERLGYPLREWF
ncbi:hypothetical protein [Leptothoe sp. PORK10 BA2]|uniref:hypothetical protein n=1 Tax=Leptothoe sp. PORK10 BA2 TaxID=3110254 RepID=UPI002B1F61C4|nr:hypothetical protein [Leptothoe sp. PORK10 BA2]MEA5463271.1 hypothetical protein [Leptothoe sp. PORK10 BA2]